MYDNFNVRSVLYAKRKRGITEGEPLREIHTDGFQPWSGPCCVALYLEVNPKFHIRAVFDDGSDMLIFDIDQISSHPKEEKNETE